MTTEHTSAVDAASIVGVAREKCLQTAHYFLLGSLDRFRSHWAHPRVWLRGSPSPLPQAGHPTLVPNSALGHSLRQPLLAGKYPNAKCAFCSTFSHLVPPLSEEIPLPGSSQTHNNIQAIPGTHGSFPPSSTQRPKSSPRMNPPCESHTSSRADRQSYFQPHLRCHFAPQT